MKRNLTQLVVKDKYYDERIEQMDSWFDLDDTAWLNRRKTKFQQMETGHERRYSGDSLKILLQQTNKRLATMQSLRRWERKQLIANYHQRQGRSDNELNRMYREIAFRTRLVRGAASGNVEYRLKGYWDEKRICGRSPADCLRVTLGQLRTGEATKE